MPLNADAIRSLTFPEIEQTVDEKDCMLFALSVGVGRDPLDQHELLYVFEENLRVFPTMPIVLGHPGPWMAAPDLRITRQMRVHGTQRLECFEPLRPGVPFIARDRIIDLVDKGAQSGAIIVTERTLRDKASGRPIARMESGIFCRADGGFEGKRQLDRDFLAVPTRAPDGRTDLVTTPDQALLYRLNGDRNPLHASPAFAEKAGFPRPILHGLCTYSVAAHGLMRIMGPAKSLRSIEARFSRPVYPGETLRIEAWHEAGRVAFRGRVDARDLVVLDRGSATFD